MYTTKLKRIYVTFCKLFKTFFVWIDKQPEISVCVPLNVFYYNGIIYITKCK